MVKKTFKNAPLADMTPQMAFISGAEQQPAFNQEQPAEAKYKLDSRFVEVKTKRVQLVMQPSLYAEAKAVAEANETSLNELVHEALRAYLGKEQ